MTQVLKRDWAVVRILGAELEDASYALIGMNRLETTIASKFGANLGIMRDDISLIFMSGDKAFMGADCRRLCHGLGMTGLTRFIRRYAALGVIVPLVTWDQCPKIRC